MTTEVFDAAVSVAREVGYRNVTRRLIANKLAGAEGAFKDRPEQAMNHLVNHTKMEDLIQQLMGAKEKLALVPGKRQGATGGSSFWRQVDRADFLDHAYRLATSNGLLALTLTDVARDMECSRGTLVNYFGGLDGLRAEVVRLGVKHQNLKLCAQAVASGLPCGSEVPQEFRQAALKSLA